VKVLFQVARARWGSTFCRNGGGDYFGFLLTFLNDARDENIFIWEHQYDNRRWKTNN